MIMDPYSDDDEPCMDDYDDDFEDRDEPHCDTCGGAGWVESVARESGRYFYDTDSPGTCPNCGGSGLRKDQKTF